MEIYTKNDWTRDRSFSAEIGQEVDPDIYEEMYDCLPPLRLAGDTPMNARLGIVSGFRVGEPYIHAKRPSDGSVTAFYAAFGKSADGHCYFLGHQNKYGEIFDRSIGRIIENI